MEVRGHPVHNRPVRPPVLDPAPSRGELPTRLLPSDSAVFQTHYRPGLAVCGQALRELVTGECKEHGVKS